MKKAPTLALLLPLLGLASPAQAENALLACQIASQEGVRQDIVLEVRDSRVRYGSSPSSMVVVELAGKSLVANSETISFKQNFPSTGVVWNWSVDRASGEITIKYVNSRNGKTFLTKTGSCRSL